MTSSEFIVDDYYELLAIHRAFMEAKFCDDANDRDVSGSPIIASLHQRLIVNLIEASVANDGESERTRWIEWLNLSDTRREWTVAIERAQSEIRWKGWSDIEKREYSLSLLAPFTFSDEMLLKFIAQV